MRMLRREHGTGSPEGIRRVEPSLSRRGPHLRNLNAEAPLHAPSPSVERDKGLAPSGASPAAARAWVQRVGLREEYAASAQKKIQSLIS